MLTFLRSAFVTHLASCDAWWDARTHVLHDAMAGARPTLLRKLEHSVGADELGDPRTLAAATGNGAGIVGAGAAAAGAKLPQYAVKPGLGGIFFGKGQQNSPFGPHAITPASSNTSWHSSRQCLCLKALLCYRCRGSARRHEGSRAGFRPGKCCRCRQQSATTGEVLSSGQRGHLYGCVRYTGCVGVQAIA